MFFDDYFKTGKVYHIAPVNDLGKILSDGIKHDDKVTYEYKYYAFHCFIDSMKPAYIPSWVKRKDAIFATKNYRREPGFCSHSVVMALDVEPSKCWIANENRANQIYEPFILQGVDSLRDAGEYVKTQGRKLIEEYWETSLSFEENLRKRMDLKDGYDAEVLIFHDVRPEDIEILYIVSDHRVMKFDEWKKVFCKKR
ncbi:MAG: hypothetical protein ACOCG5_02220 [Candidatus Alkaliphilus sp. MAG34]|mgnify:CR=1 FL=1|nr:hypothetical protein [Clostridiales bacterium]